MKKFEMPKAELIVFQVEDVVATSNDDFDAGEGGTPGMGM